ncbi:MAG: SGNH hydrolase domain-containing protein, partial [Candidatus Thiodiazotropha sp.]
VATNEDTRYDKCTEFNDIVLQKLTADDSVKVVMLSAYWALYENGVRMQTDPNHGSVYLCESENCTALSTGDNSKLMKQGLKNIIELLVASGKKVILIGPIPELEINGAATIARMELLDKVREVRSHWKSVKSRMQGSIAVLNDLQDGNDITSVFPHRVLCGDDFCEVETKDMPLCGYSVIQADSCGQHELSVEARIQ